MKKYRPIISILLCLTLLISSGSTILGAEFLSDIPDSILTEDGSEDTYGTVSAADRAHDTAPDADRTYETAPDADAYSTVPAYEDIEIISDDSSDESLSDLSDIGTFEDYPAETPTSEEALSDLSTSEEALSDLSSSEEALSDLSTAEEAEKIVGQATVTPTPAGKGSHTTAASYTSDTPKDGKTYIISCAGNSDYCLDINGGSLDQDANLHIYKENGSDSQLFTLKKLSDGSFVLYNYNSDKVIAVSGSSAAIRTNVAQRAYTGSVLQKWILKKNTDGSYSICSKADQKQALHILTGIIKNRQNVRLYTAFNTNAQKFVFREALTDNLSGQMMLRPKYVSYMSVGSGGSTSDGANLQLEIGASGDLFQTFTLTRVWGAFYKIVHKKSGKVVDVAAGLAADGTNVQLYTWNNTAAQLWKVQINDDGSYTFRSRTDLNYVLDMAAGGKAAKTNLQLYSWNNTSSQKFVIGRLSATLPQNIDLTVESTINTNRVFTASSTGFMTYGFSKAANKKFTLVPISYGGTTNYWYKIVTPSGKVLGVNGTSASEGLFVSEQEWDGTKHQIWNPKYLTDGTYIFRSCMNLSYLMSVYGSSEDYRAKIQIRKNDGSKSQRWHLASYTVKSCRISTSDHNTVTLTAVGSTVKSDDKKAYLFAVEPYEHVIKGKSPVASASLDTSVSFTAGLNKNSSSSLLQKKFYVAVKYCGMYRIVSNAFYITNPEAAATNARAFPTPARGTKKGLKLGVSDRDIAQAKTLKVSHACIDIPLDLFYGGTGYAYKYEGKTYQFSSDISYYKNQIKKYNDSGIVVTANVYLSTRKFPELLQPEARRGSKLSAAGLFGYNTRDAGRKKVEAIFACMADAFTSDGCLVANWVFANEANNFAYYYYCGDISYYRYHEALAEGYRMFNACVKSRWKNARCYISLDHNWNVEWPVAGSYMGMDLLADFNMDLSRQGNVHWDLAMHPYPAPEQDCRFWNRAMTVTNSGDTAQITMLNLSYWATYIKMTYGAGVRIILNEMGLSSNYNGTDMLNQQGAALALAYYFAEFDKNVDELDYHRNIDDPSETAAGWHLGLYFKPSDTWEYTQPKPSANVFRYMDSGSWNSATKNYIPLTGKSSWKAWVSGFDAARFQGKS